MANSKSDDRAPKMMDIMQPGKTAPPTTARPVIVSNRPILRQDPMMVSPDGMEKSTEPPARTNVSRVGKTLTVLAPHQSKTAKAATIIPLSDADKAKENTSELVTASGRPIAASVPQGRIPEEIATKKAIEVKTDDASSNSVAAPTPELTAAEETVALPSEPTVQPPAPVEPSIPTPEVALSKPESPSVPAAPQATAASTPVSAPGTSLSTEDDISVEGDVSAADSEPTNSPDGQLAPNKTLDEAKRKADDIEAARLAEQEQIIASRRYYLPITNTYARRGLTRSLIVLLLVLILAAVWFDIVLDAGIVHVGGLQPLTHFFR